MAEWLRRWTWNPMGSPRVGSNPARSVVHRRSVMDFFSLFFSYHMRCMFISTFLGINRSVLIFFSSCVIVQPSPPLRGVKCPFRHHCTRYGARDSLHPPQLAEVYAPSRLLTAVTYPAITVLASTICTWVVNDWTRLSKLHARSRCVAPIMPALSLHLPLSLSLPISPLCLWLCYHPVICSCLKEKSILLCFYFLVLPCCVVVAPEIKKLDRPSNVGEQMCSLWLQTCTSCR